MLLVIHNLPKEAHYIDIKSLIQMKCGLNEVILDNLELEGENKRVTVGLADEGDAALLVRKINGLYLSGCQLYVEDIRQKKRSEQPYRPIENPHVPQIKPTSVPTWPQSNPYNSAQAMQPTMQPTMQPNMQPVMQTPMVAYSNLPFYMSPKTGYPSYESQAVRAPAPTQKPLPQPAYQSAYQQPQPNLNQWTIPKLPAYTSYPHHTYTSPANTAAKTSNNSEPSRHRRSPSPRRDDEPWRGDRNQTDRGDPDRYGRRSPYRDHERSGSGSSRSKTSRWNESDKRRDRSPARSRDYRDSRRDDDDARHRSRSDLAERSPPRDRRFGARKRDDRDHNYRRDRDRKQKLSPDRSKKSYDKPRVYDKGRDTPTKRPYSEVSQSSKSFGNDPDSSSFGVSNEEIFDKPSDPSPVSVSPKRSRFDQVKLDNAGDSSGTADTKDTLAKMVNKHNLFRAQAANVLTKEIIFKSRRDPPFYAPKSVFRKLKECIVARINVTMGDKIATSKEQILYLYRARYPEYGDKALCTAIEEDLVRLEEAEAEKEEDGSASAVDQSTVTTPVPKPAAPAFIPSTGNISGTAVAGFQTGAPIPTVENRTLYPNPCTIIAPPKLNPNFQNRAPAPTPQLQNVPQTPQFQNLPQVPQSQNALQAPQFQNTPQVPQFQNRPQVPQFQNRPQVPQFQNRPQVPQFQNRPQVPKFQNRPQVPKFQNRPPVPKFQNRPQAPKFQNRPQAPNQFPFLPQGKKQKKKQAAQNFPPTSIFPMNKKEANKQKQQVKIEFKTDDISSIYNIEDPLLKQALEEETNALVELYKEKPDVYMHKPEFEVFKRISAETGSAFSRLLKLYVTKRVLNITTGLVLRVFPAGKWPNHSVMNNYLKTHGAICVRKCPKMYVVTFGSYKAYDEFLKMDSFTVGDSNMFVKPMNISGPPLSVREKKKLQSGNSSEQIQDPELITFGGETGEDGADAIADDSANDSGAIADDNATDSGAIADDSATDSGAIADDSANDSNVMDTSQDVILVEQDRVVVCVDDDDDDDKVTNDPGKIPIHPWWTPELDAARQEMRELFIRAKTSGQYFDWSMCKAARAAYKQLVQRRQDEYKNREEEKDPDKVPIHPWRTPELDAARQEVRELFDRAKTSGQDLDKSVCKAARAVYKKLVQKRHDEYKTREKNKARPGKVFFNPWWCPELEQARQEARHYYSIASNTQKEFDWNLWKAATVAYKHLVRKHKKLYKASLKNKDQSNADSSEKEIGATDMTTETVDRDVETLANESEVTDQNVENLAEKSQLVEEEESNLEEKSQNVEEEVSNFEEKSQNVEEEKREITEENVESLANANEESLETTQTVVQDNIDFVVTDDIEDDDLEDF